MAVCGNAAKSRRFYARSRQHRSPKTAQAHVKTNLRDVTSGQSKTAVCACALANDLAELQP
jgi:predicted RNA-binding Zn ribbon-like protein